MLRFENIEHERHFIELKAGHSVNCKKSIFQILFSCNKDLRHKFLIGKSGLSELFPAVGDSCENGFEYSTVVTETRAEISGFEGDVLLALKESIEFCCESCMPSPSDGYEICSKNYLKMF